MARAERENENKRNDKNVKKADYIIEQNENLSARMEELLNGLKLANEKIDAAMGNRVFSGGEGDSRTEDVSGLKRELDFIAAQNASVFTELKRIIREWGEIAPGRTGGYERSRMQEEIDYDRLARRVIDLMPPQEYVSADYIACKVAEQIALPENASAPAAQRESAPAAPYTINGPVDLNLDEEELADRVALKVGSIKAEDFDILVDDDGCSSISDSIVEKLNYDAISGAVAEKLRTALENSAEGNDYDEMATRISEKITVAGINEDAIADKAAAALSNFLPEIDTDEIADKVASQVLHGMPEMDNEALCKNISDKLIESQESHDYDVVLDEEGIGKITRLVTDEVNKNVDGRFAEINKRLDELRALITGGAVVAAAKPADDGLLTVSEVVENKEPAEAEETAGENISDSAFLGVMVDELSENPSADEASEDLIGGAVDFEHMMKYNRSFIARIIQSTDEQKEYYGQVKTALLSYAKVNSSLAWGAERFNKGRDTVARFKIRGKTLCLYLALDPAQYKTSVYHHFDVSDNKSMRGTPMMVKIKSPLGVKKAVRLIDDMLENLGAVKRNRTIERDYAAMYPYESMEELIEDGLVKEVDKN